MKLKTSELQGAALDWATSVALGYSFYDELTIGVVGKLFGPGAGYKYPHVFGQKAAWSEAWAQGGPIIEQEGIAIDAVRCDGRVDSWVAGRTYPDPYIDGIAFAEEGGPTPLIAAMRCFVASRLGDEVDVPEELME